MKGIIINARREEYGISDVKDSMTVGEMIEMLRGFDPDTKIFVGNDRDIRLDDCLRTVDYGWYTYGGICPIDINEWTEEEEEDDEEEV